MVPHPPRCALGPQVVQDQEVAVGVHAVPEAVVPVRGELALGDQTSERLLDEVLALPDVLEHRALEGEEPSVDAEPTRAHVHDVPHEPSDRGRSGGGEGPSDCVPGRQRREARALPRCAL